MSKESAVNKVHEAKLNFSEILKHIMVNATSPQGEHSADNDRVTAPAVSFSENATIQHRANTTGRNHNALQMEDLQQIFLAKIDSSHKNVAMGTDADTSNHYHRKYSAFAEYVADKLSGYDKLTRSEVEFKISKLLYETDMTILKKQLEDFVSCPFYCSEGTSPVDDKKGDVSAAISDESSYFTTDLATSGTSGYPSGTSSTYNAVTIIKTETHTSI